MCGVFGFIGTRVDLIKIKRLCELNESRGEHAFGLGWLNRRGDSWYFKSPGKPSSFLSVIDNCSNSIAVIGHCRWATHGDPDDNANNHPFFVDRYGMIVHNGIILNYREIAFCEGIDLVSDCDSEVIAKLTEKGIKEGKSVLDSFSEAMGMLEGSAAVLGLFPCRKSVVWGSVSQSLFWEITSSGVYWSSVPEGLSFPKRCKPYIAGEWTIDLDKRKLFHRWRRISRNLVYRGSYLSAGDWGDSFYGNGGYVEKNTSSFGGSKHFPSL